MNSVSIAALRNTLWYKELFADVSKTLFVANMASGKATSCIQIITDLSKSAGSTVTFGLSTKLAGSGVTGDSELEGNEEGIVSYSESLIVDQLRHAVRLTGRMDEKKVAYNMRADAKEKLRIWWQERIDQELLDKLCGKTSSTFANTPDAPSANRSVWAGGVSSDGALTASMTFDTKVIDKAKQMARLSGVKVRPLSMEGDAYKGKALYYMFVHPYQAANLRNDPVWNQAQRDANVRGADNPILNGALGVYNNVVIFEHEGIYAFNGGSGSAPIARAVLLGQQAAILAYGSDQRWVEKTFDYENKTGFSVGRIFGVVKPQFNSEDYGVITVATAATTLSTA